MHVNMRQETAQTKASWWVSNIKAFFHLPNPRIFTLFIISSTATFSLGIAMIFEWVFYGQNHPGYHWILCYALSLIALPVLVGIICIIFAIFFYSRDPSTLPISDLSKNQTQIEVREQVKDHQALEQNETVHDRTSGSAKEPQSLRPTVQARNDMDEKLSLKRTISLPFSQTCTAYRNTRRTSSFRL